MKLSLLRLFVPIFGALLLTACGGGTGDSTSSGSGTGSGTGTGTGTVTASATLTLSLLNSLGAATTTISESQSGTLSALVLDTSGLPVASQVVSFTVDNATVAVLDPVSGTALTNVSGIASISLKAGSAAGAATATATAVVGADTAANSASFSSSLANIALGSGSGIGFSNGALTASVVPPAELSAGGTMTITATVVDQSSSNALFTNPVDVVFTSGCAAASTAQIDGSVSTVNGVATATYQADGCVGPDTISATAAGGLSATVAVLVAGADIGSIETVSISEQNVSIKGTGGGGRAEQSLITFVVKDINGNPVTAGQQVDFEVDSTVGGLALSQVSQLTNGSGQVQVTLTSGTQQTVVSVKATTTTAGGGVISHQAAGIVISVGLADSNRFSLASEIFNPEYLTTDGGVVVLSVSMADRFGVAVEGANVTFKSEEGGFLEAPGSCVTNASGQCSINWLSQTAPGSGLGDNGDARIRVVAFAEGTENFIDNDGNGIFDDTTGTPDTFTDVDEVFLDGNDNGSYDLGEFFEDRDLDTQYSAGDSVFNGVLCNPGIAVPTGVHCDGLVHVRDTVNLVKSGSNIAIGLAPADPYDVSVATGATQFITITVQDALGNTPPGNSSVVVTLDESGVGKLLGVTGFVVPTNIINPPSFGITLAHNSAATAIKGGSMTVTVTTPAGIVSSRTVTVTDGP
ncbi:MAG: Ig-like domain-containing protein [Motiliproteus sp.]